MVFLPQLFKKTNCFHISINSAIIESFAKLIDVTPLYKKEKKQENYEPVRIL